MLNFVMISSILWLMTTCQQQPLFFGPKGGHCTQIWLYLVLKLWNLRIWVRICRIYLKISVELLSVKIHAFDEFYIWIANIDA